jgi:uncharacterized protein YunC (DUF1805 family)
MDVLKINGKEFRGDTIPLFGINLMVIQGKKGMLGCAYVNLAVAEKTSAALAVVRGVSNYDDMLRAQITDVTSAAAALGISPGMTGAEALELLA